MTPEELADIAESSRLDNLTNLLGIINIVLVLLTAAVTIGTFIYGSKLSNIKEKIANRRIIDAQTRASIADSAAQTAKATAEIANTAAIEAKNRQAELQIDLENSKKETAQAQLALSNKIDEDRKKARPRRISTNQTDDILNLLKVTPIPPVQLNIMISLGDKEAEGLATDIINIFKIAGWNVAPVIGRSVESYEGFYIITKDGNMVTLPRGIRHLVSLLNKNEIHTQIVGDNTIMDGTLFIIVGHKQ